jgi:uncharacterized protein
MEYEFDWDEDKARENLRKHDVTFEEAVQAFGDPNSVILEDARRYGEQRFKLVGASTHHLLAVIFTDRDDCTRVISARDANRNERKDYQSQIEV